MPPDVDPTKSQPSTSRQRPRPLPRWVRVVLIVTIAVVAAVIASLLVGGHGPGRHFGLEMPGHGISTFLAVAPW